MPPTDLGMGVGVDVGTGVGVDGGGPSLTEVFWLTELLPGVGSMVVELTVTLLWSVPVVPEFTVTTRVRSM